MFCRNMAAGRLLLTQDLVSFSERASTFHLSRVACLVLFKSESLGLSAIRTRPLSNVSRAPIRCEDFGPGCSHRDRIEMFALSSPATNAKTSGRGLLVPFCGYFRPTVLQKRLIQMNDLVFVWNRNRP
jgi:hypothetical protein